ncbi:MAG: tRNA dihydrouridine(20/20a) synthase DusA [Pseudomonadota bacterium]
MPPNAATDAARLSVAPMMDWTDRHCRVFHRVLSRRTRLYTEMVTAAAVLHGPRDRLLAFDAVEHPVALQLGGSDPVELAAAVRLAAPYGYDEINLNVGCPSDRVQSGCFGAVLMEQPGLVADCVAAMAEVADVPVTVKCRIGVDDQDPTVALPALLDRLVSVGVDHVIVHARKAWLSGLSPKENRDIPPLRYDLVAEVAARYPALAITLNGGIDSLAAAERHLAEFAGVMVGRAAYHAPFDLLGRADSRIVGVPDPVAAPEDAARAMLPYIEAHLSGGGRLHQVTRHMLGLFAGRPGARGWRRTLSERANAPGAGPEVVQAALSHVIAQAA